MLKLFANLPISRRIFLAFFLAALLPDISILVISVNSIQAFNAHGLNSSATSAIVVGAIAAILVSTGIVIGLGYLMNMTISQPLSHLATLTRRIAKGETNARATLDGRDEIALVASTMNNMLDNIVRLIQETQGQRDMLQAQVEKLVNEVSVVGEGDLRIQAEVTTDALGVLADSFNYMIEELSSLVVRVKSVAQGVENSTTSTFEYMSQLVYNADQQLAQIATATAEIEQMAHASRRVAERSQVLYETATEARLSARSGRGTVQQTIEGMTHINQNVQGTARKVQLLGERSREINDIVEAISGIAHQTNRLALDAAIQAAMAGENGKGFGAVAADIRRLAERSKEQTSRITKIIQSVREEIGAVAVAMHETERETSLGANLVQETGTTLATIFSLVEQQAQEIETINQVGRQQLQSSSMVVQIMQDVSISTQQSSDSTRHVAHNMELLAKQAEQLLASVEAFKLKERLTSSTQGRTSTIMASGFYERSSHIIADQPSGFVAS
ncbi:MAG TPA: methyl-accepting chemotaxis protein [Ktedonosporobacter sp.]|nr:methyl-accepting chemotaxis protein [Ktedonosporobacter sp.]